MLSLYYVIGTVALCTIGLGAFAYYIFKNVKVPSLPLQNNKTEPEKYFKYVHHLLNLKFNFWFQSEILPAYVARKPETVTKKKIKETLDKFINDVIGTTNKKELDIVLNYYFDGELKAFELYLKQYFMNKIYTFEKTDNYVSPNKMKEIING